MAPLAPPKFVQTYLPLAQQWEAKTGIPASMYLAIIASESNWGNADNALFGIKGSGNAGSLNSPTWESVNGQRVDTSAGFANYKNANDAFQGFWDLMQTPYYASALKELTVNHDPDAFIHRINQLNYATDPSWADKITSSARTTMTPLIQQAGGGAQMSQMQEGSPPAGGVSDEDVAALLKKYTSGGGSTASDTITVTGGDGNTYLVNKTTGQGTLVQGVPSKQPDQPPADKVSLQTGPDGILYLVNESKGTSVPVTGFPQASKPEKGTGEFNTVTDPRTGKPIALQNPTTGATIQLPDLSTSAQDQTVSLGARGVYVIHNDGSGHYTTQTIIPPAPDAPQDPNDIALKQAQTANLQANTAKTQQGLRPVAQAAVQDAYATIEGIRAQVASGQMTPSEADALMTQVHQGLAATLAGTTIFEQKQQAENTQTQRANTAANLLNQRVSSAASLGASLFNAATANGGILKPPGGGSWGINPLQIGNDEVNAMGGGQSTGDAAAAFLKAALGGGGSPAPGDQGPMPGAPAPAPSQFPTTREAVLAQYPHLANQGQPVAQPAPALAVAPTVLPPTPLGNIPTLLASIGQGGR